MNNVVSGSGFLPTNQSETKSFFNRRISSESPIQSISDILQEQTPTDLDSRSLQPRVSRWQNVDISEEESSSNVAESSIPSSSSFTDESSSSEGHPVNFLFGSSPELGVFWTEEFTRRELGEKLGDVVWGKKLGEGAFGSVYLAESNAFDGKVALKFYTPENSPKISPDMANPGDLIGLLLGSDRLVRAKGFTTIDEEGNLHLHMLDSNFSVQNIMELEGHRITSIAYEYLDDAKSLGDALWSYQITFEEACKVGDEVLLQMQEEGVFTEEEAKLIGQEVAVRLSQLEEISFEDLTSTSTDVLFDLGYYSKLMMGFEERIQAEFMARLPVHERVSPEEARQIGAQVLEGLQELHDNRIIHRDVKPDNVMLTPLGARLIDWNTLIIPTSEDQKTSEVQGTQGYLAPEVFKHPSYGKEVDVFSFGVLLYELNYGKLEHDSDLIYSPKTWKNNFKDNLKTKGGHLNRQDKKLLDDLLKRLLHTNPKYRVPLELAKKHPYFTRRSYSEWHQSLVEWRDMRKTLRGF